MIMAMVRFESSLTDEQAIAIAKERLPQFQAIPGLVQKYYVRNAETGKWMGVYIWDSLESLKTFRESDLAKSIPAAYQVKGTPQVEIGNIAMTLRD